jgi:uncharacterized membrane protein YeiH
MGFFYACDLFGVAVFAASGALMANRKSLDLLGVLVISMVTALGGGTLRDAVLGRFPVSWVRDDWYIATATLAAILVMARGRLPQLMSTQGLLFADALGLAIATILGADIAVQMHAPISAAIILGTISGVAGGVMRDVICNEIPLILQREIYATAGIIGAGCFTFLLHSGWSRQLASLIAMAIIFVIRVAAMRWRWALPRFQRRLTT